MTKSKHRIKDYQCKRCGLTKSCSTKEEYEESKKFYEEKWTPKHALNKEIRGYKCGPNCPLEPYQYLNKKGRMCIAFKRMDLIQKDIDTFKAQVAEKLAEPQGEEARGGDTE
jgi:hypothetical protein